MSVLLISTRKKIPFYPFRWVKNLSDVSLLERECRLGLNYCNTGYGVFKEERLERFLAINQLWSNEIIEF